MERNIFLWLVISLWFIASCGLVGYGLEADKYNLTCICVGSASVFAVMCFASMLDGYEKSKKE